MIAEVFLLEIPHSLVSLYNKTKIENFLHKQFKN